MFQLGQNPKFLSHPRGRRTSGSPKHKRPQDQGTPRPFHSRYSHYSPPPQNHTHLNAADLEYNRQVSPGWESNEQFIGAFIPQHRVLFRFVFPDDLLYFVILLGE